MLLSSKLVDFLSYSFIASVSVSYKFKSSLQSTDCQAEQGRVSSSVCLIFIYLLKCGVPRLDLPIQSWLLVWVACLVWHNLTFTVKNIFLNILFLYFSALIRCEKYFMWNLMMSGNKWFEQLYWRTTYLLALFTGAERHNRSKAWKSRIGRTSLSLK